MATSLPADPDELRKLAQAGDQGAKWLLSKIKAIEMVRSLDHLVTANDREVLEIATALLDIEGVAHKPQVQIQIDIEKKMEKAGGKLAEIMTAVRRLLSPGAVS
jgi:hypothetical protein